MSIQCELLPSSQSAMSVQLTDLPTTIPEVILDDELEEEQASTFQFIDIRPSFFTVSDWKEKLDKYPWLLYSDELLGCSYCHKVKSLNTDTSSGIKIDKYWKDTKVSISGFTTAAKKSSIRRKISSHKDTQAHKLAEKIIEKKSESVITAIIDNQNLEHLISTKRCFYTVYYLSKLIKQSPEQLI